MSLRGVRFLACAKKELKVSGILRYAQNDRGLEMTMERLAMTGEDA